MPWIPLIVFLGLEVICSAVTWRELRNKCARPLARIALTVLAVLLAVSVMVTFATATIPPTVLSLVLFAFLIFGSDLLVRVTGGPDPRLLVQYQLKRVLDLAVGSAPATERHREAIERLSTLEPLRTPQTARVIDAASSVIKARFETPEDIDAVDRAYAHLQAEIQLLQGRVGRPPDRET